MGQACVLHVVWSVLDTSGHSGVSSEIGSQCWCPTPEPYTLTCAAVVSQHWSRQHMHQHAEVLLEQPTAALQ